MKRLLRSALALGARRPRVLAFIDLVQDVDVMLPVLLALREQGGIGLKIHVSRWLQRESPRTEVMLREHGLDFAYLPRRQVIEGRAPTLRGADALIAAAESTHPAHSAAHALAQRAKAAGLKTYALQHGFENVGLFGVETAAASFASDVVFCWFPKDAIPAALSPGTRGKLAHVGRPGSVGAARAAESAFDVGVFENLHWDRYDDADRSNFLAGLTAAVRALPQVRFLLRSHPAAGWADQFGHDLAQFANISRDQAAMARGRPQGGADIIQGLARVITTPSTVALDAAMAGVPVALAAAGGKLYDPLPLLRSPDDWIGFAAGGAFDRRTLDQFCSRVLVGGDGAVRIAERLRRDLMGASQHHHG